MKTAIYWFAFLSEQEQREFRANCEDFHEYMQIGCFSFMTFIAVAFNWENTPQGHDYWNEISNRKVQ